MAVYVNKVLICLIFSKIIALWNYVCTEWNNYHKINSNEITFSSKSKFMSLKIISHIFLALLEILHLRFIALNVQKKVHWQNVISL